MRNPFGLWQKSHLFPVKLSDDGGDYTFILHQFEPGILPRVSGSAEQSSPFALVIISPTLTNSTGLQRVLLDLRTTIAHRSFYNGMTGHLEEIHVAGNVPRFVAAASEAEFATKHMETIGRLLANIQGQTVLRPEPTPPNSTRIIADRHAVSRHRMLWEART